MLFPRALLALLPLAALSCGDPAATAENAPLAVLQRGLSWERRGAEPTPLTLAWTRAEGLDAWTRPGHADRAPADSGVLRLDGPLGSPFDPAVHHWLTLRGTTSTSLNLTVFWRSGGEAFDKRRASTPMRLPASDKPQTWSLPLDSLRAAREGADVSQGVDQFRLVFRGPTGAATEPDLESIVLSSDFDAAPGGPLPHHRLSVAGVLRDGVALHTPGTLVADIAPGPHDRLRLGLALAGCDKPLDVTLRDEAGHLEARTVRCVPGADWLDVVIDLAPLHGRPARLLIEAPEAPTPQATVLVGGVLRLGPDGQDLPDVVFYVEDTLRADHLTTYGHNLATDPHLQRVARDGAVFEHAFAASSWTRPSVSTLHTSLDPIAHGNVTHANRVADQLDTLAETLADAGYLTASFVTNYHGGGWSGLDQGFDVAHEPTAHGTTAITSTLTSAAVADPIDAFLAEHIGERVFVFVQSLDPHAPYEPLAADHYALLRDSGTPPGKPAKRGRTDLARRYDAEILHNDHYLEQLDDALAATGRAQRTLFMFASDHGEAFGEHGQFEHRKSLHQEELAVPWIVRWPGVIAPGQRIEAWAGHIDMAPTLVGLLDLRAPSSWEGRDLSALLTPYSGGPSRSTPELDRPLLVHMVHEDETSQSIAVIRAPYKLLMSLDEHGNPTGQAQLLDLVADPGELHPVPLDGTDSPAAAAARAMESWARRTIAESRKSAVHGEAEAMSPAMREWMREMGYL